MKLKRLLIISLFFVMFVSTIICFSKTDTEKKDTASNLNSGKTVITMVSSNVTNDISIMITSSNGTVIVCDPMQMPENINPNLILVTHGHHYEASYIMKFPDVKKSLIKAESFTFNNINITGVAASHNETAIIKDYPGYIFYIIEADDLRIAYFSCLGQNVFYEEQMKALEKIDIAIITADDYPGFISTLNASKLMKQLKPQIIIPLSHHTVNFETAIKTISEASESIVEKVDKSLTISKNDLNNSKQN